MPSEEGMPAELRLEILAYAPTAFIACRNCEVALGEAGVSRQRSRGAVSHRVTSRTGPRVRPPLRRLRELAARYQGRIAVDVVEWRRCAAFWRSLRHGIRHYSAVIVGGGIFATEFSVAADAVDGDLRGGASLHVLPIPLGTMNLC